MIFKDEEWVSLCELTDAHELQFSKEFLELTSELGGQRRPFAAQLITHWSSDFARLLDYFGTDDDGKDHYSGIDGDPMDVREDITEVWEYQNVGMEGLTAEWHRDLLRAKLATLKIPKRLLRDYLKVYKKNPRFN